MGATTPIIVITGTSRGIGRFLAEHYAARGWRVIGCSRGESVLAVDGYEHHRVDVRDEDAVCKLFRQVRRDHGGLDALVNNAALATMNHSLLTPGSTVRDLLETNVLGTFVCCREAAKLMRTRPGGRIVNFGTVATPLTLAGEAIYAASKAAVESLTATLAREFAEFGITVNAVAPSPIETAMTHSVPAEKIRKLLERQAIRAYATFADVANVVDFFLRPESRFVTGQILYLGGV